MRGTLFAVLLVGVGCRSVPERVCGSGDCDAASSARQLSQMVSVAATGSDIVPVMFTSQPKSDAGVAGSDIFAAGHRRPR